MNITVLTPEKELYSGPIISVQVPGTSGQFQILKGHAPIVSSLEAGVIKIEAEKGETIELEIANGYLEVLREEVSVLIIEPVKEEVSEEADNIEE